jgi:hypothetical protein
MALNGPGAPTLGQPGVDGIPVVTQISAEAAQFGRTSFVHLGDPLIQLAATTFANQPQELLR